MSTQSSFLSRALLAGGLTFVAAACGSSTSSPVGPGSLPAQGATIQGVINGSPASTASAHTSSLAQNGLRVSVMGQGQSATTDSEGRFTLRGVSAGSRAIMRRPPRDRGSGSPH